MKLGFLTAPFRETPFMEVADWAAAAGFEVLEIACWPKATGPTRRYAGTSHIDVANLSDSQASEIVDELAAKGLSGIFWMGMGWQTPRLPGLGEVAWGVVHGELYRQGYEGDCIIEHESRRFEGSDAKVKQGLLIARDILRPFCH